MKALILTCNTGGGHNAVSAAIQEAFASHGAECRTEDALSFLSERASEFISNWHVRIYRHMPTANRVGYRYSEKHPAMFDEDTPVYKLLASGAERLHEYVAAGGYTCLICPHVLSAMMVTQLLSQHPGEGLQSCFIATDYTCSPMVNESRLDWYFVPDAAVVPEFLAAGIPEEKIAVMPGIPVRRDFYRRVPNAAAKEKLGLPGNCRHLLMMCGSMGCGPMEELAESFAEQMAPEDRLTVICGTNAHLKKKLDKEYVDREDVRILGYSDDISLLMDSADLYLTKPGGISTAESAVKGLPMVLVDVVAGCEEYNLRHFCELGAAVVADKPEELADLCRNLLADAEARSKMARAVLQQGNAADAIYARMAGDRALQ